MDDESIKQRTEELLNAYANLKKAKSLLEEAENALTANWIAIRPQQPDEMLVNTSEGWILLKFGGDASGFREFKRFGDYVIP